MSRYKGKKYVKFWKHKMALLNQNRNPESLANILENF